MTAPRIDLESRCFYQIGLGAKQLPKLVALGFCFVDARPAAGHPTKLHSCPIPLPALNFCISMHSPRAYRIRPLAAINIAETGESARGRRS
jgi:hypothetical protein